MMDFSNILERLNICSNGRCIDCEYNNYKTVGGMALCQAHLIKETSNEINFFKKGIDSSGKEKITHVCTQCTEYPDTCVNCSVVTGNLTKE